jgi:uncharacterized protein (TIRG00374 family)
MLRRTLSKIKSWKLDLSLKIIISFTFVYFILTKIDSIEFAEILRNTNVLFLFLSFLLSPIMILVSVWKWHILLKAQHKSVSFVRLLGLYYVGYLFNHLLPTSVGGDVITSYELGKHTGGNAESVASVFMNRFTGFIMLILAACVSLVVNINLFSDLSIAFAMGLMVFGSILLVWAILDERLTFLVERQLGNSQVSSKIIAKSKKMRNALLVYRNDLRTLIYAFSISIIFLMLMIINIYIGCLAFNIHPSLPGLLVITPFIQVVSMLPISLGGVGLREWAYIIAFPQIGLSASVGLSVCLLLRFKGIVSGFIGGILYPLVTRKRVHEYAAIQPS